MAVTVLHNHPSRTGNQQEHDHGHHRRRGQSDSDTDGDDHEEVPALLNVSDLRRKLKTLKRAVDEIEVFLDLSVYQGLNTREGLNISNNIVNMEISRDLRNPPASMQSSRVMAPRVDNNNRFDMTGAVVIEEDLVVESSSKS